MREATQNYWNLPGEYYAWKDYILNEMELAEKFFLIEYQSCSSIQRTQTCISPY